MRDSIALEIPVASLTFCRVIRRVSLKDFSSSCYLNITRVMVDKDATSLTGNDLAQARLKLSADRHGQGGRQGWR